MDKSHLHMKWKQLPKLKDYVKTLHLPNQIDANKQQFNIGKPCQ